MTQDEQEEIAALRAGIATAKGIRALAGWLLIVAIGLILVSIATGNKALGFCAVCWIASSIVASMASSATLELEKLEEKIVAIQYGNQEIDNIAPSYDNEVIFSPISLN